jgi:hypothetical protein
MSAASVNGSTRTAVILITLIPLVWRLSRADDIESQRPAHGPVLQLGLVGQFGDNAGQGPPCGPTVGIQIQPLAHWPEFEIDVSHYRQQAMNALELDLSIEVPVKHPSFLPTWIHVKPTIGPTWTTTSLHDTQPWGVEAGADVTFWRGSRFGWYLEPSYEMGLGSWRDRSTELSMGLFFRLR